MCIVKVVWTCALCGDVSGIDVVFGKALYSTSFLLDDAMQLSRCPPSPLGLWPPKLAI